ncbi:hypothetical protein FBU59_001233 [Linderina macrospora]|uniref:Uncharacterized protein n=1 Tax=Linderina macrospora TaxID=4868 RepID=A0ACC1JEL8_9FUNG|nr:hypothetical protein FBU59_001233 [Linderina macrospora]
MSRTYISHIPRVASMGGAPTSVHEHASPMDTVVFNEDLAIENLHEKAIAKDSILAATNFDEIRVVPSASSSYQNVHIYGH